MSKKVTVHFDEETYDRLVENAKIHGTTKSNLIREAVRESLGKPEGLGAKDSSETLRNIQENAVRGKMRAEKLQDKAYVETSDLLTAEHLVKNCGFEVITVEQAIEEQRKPKLWKLRHPWKYHEEQDSDLAEKESQRIDDKTGKDLELPELSDDIADELEGHV